jgi:hypothetical protein
MANTKDVSVVLWRVGNLVEGWDSIIAGELEDMCWVLDHIDVDVAAFEGVDTSCRSLVSTHDAWNDHLLTTSIY